MSRRLLLACLLPSLLVGCVTSRDGGWLIQTDYYKCDNGMLPIEPMCLISANYDGGFKYSGQFQACKQSMSNFINALDEYYRCSDTKLKAIFDGLLSSVPDTYNCYVEFFKNDREGDPSQACPPVDVPRFFPSYEADGLEVSLGVPSCMRKNNVYLFSPKRAAQLSECREQAEVFTSKTMQSYSVHAASAQNQYYTYLRNLRRVLDQKADDGINKFKCLAERRSYCM